MTEVREYLSPDGQVQLDALAQTRHGRPWAVEVKWRNKCVGSKELERLVRPAKQHSAQAWFVAGAGFSVEALASAKRRPILGSDAGAIETLHKIVKEK